MHHFLAWFYWNPSKIAFTIPYIDKPIAWYGIFFVLGFILAYFILIPVISQYLLKIKTFSSLDISNWPQLIHQLASKSSEPLHQKILENIPLPIKKQLKTINLQGLIVDEDTKTAILKALSETWQKNTFTRNDFIALFPLSITNVSQTSQFLLDRLCWFVVLGTLIGARLGAVFFYDWDYFKEYPLEIFKVWKGGLASHGGTVGIILSLYLYRLYIKKWFPSLSFLQLLDFIAIPTGLVATFIRLGNFMNQEIIGTPTNLPWAVIFGNPVDKSTRVPRHPVQLYEAAAYFLIFLIMLFLWKKKGNQWRAGVLCGIFLILTYASRFFLEFWKEDLGTIHFFTLSLQMGQLLSIPIILFGIYLIWQGSKKTISQNS